MNDGAKIAKTRGLSLKNRGILEKSWLVLLESWGLCNKRNSARLLFKKNKRAEFVLLGIDIGLDAGESGVARRDIHVLCGSGIEQCFAGTEECGVSLVVG